MAVSALRTHLPCHLANSPQGDQEDTVIVFGFGWVNIN